MLYSQHKERVKRFFTALKISIPFIILIFLWIYTFFNFEDIEQRDIILFAILSLFYVYYNFYMIYNVFNTSDIEPVTNVFNRHKFGKFVKRKANKNKILAVLGIKNIDEITDRYGLENVDFVLKNFIITFNSFLEKHKIKNVPIGRFINGYFLAVFDHRNDLDHLLKTFSIEINKNGINDIEVRITFSTTPFIKSLSNAISTLSYNLLNQDKVVDLDLYEQRIANLLQNGEFSFKFQAIKSLKNQPNLIYLVQKVNLEFENITKTNLIQIINKLGLEIEYDLNSLKTLFKEKIFNKISSQIFIEISAVSIRNPHFQRELFSLIEEYKVDPKKIVFEFYEDHFYNDIMTFKNIIKSYKNFGFKFALSHFGGQNTSFSYLKYLDIDFIIFDLEFSKNYDQTKIKNIFDQICELCLNLGVKSIIRFVDKENLLNELKNSQIDYIQGFLVSKPTTLENL